MLSMVSVVRDKGRSPPSIILVEPQLGENIGAAARAMANFGVTDLRLVNPRDGWPNPQAVASASRAHHVIDAVRVYETTEQAIADLQVVYATTRRGRDLATPVIGPVDAARDFIRHSETGVRAGVLFGRERWGLTNDEVACADTIITLPVDPDFASLNIAQAVLVISYEWRKHALGAGAELPFSAADAPPSTKEELSGFLDHLQRALDNVDYFRPPEKRPHMARNLRIMFQKAGLNSNEVRTLRGVIAAFERRSKKPRADASDETKDE